MAGITTISGVLMTLMVLYILGALFAILGSAPMIVHVNPRSECLLYSSQVGDKLFYGNYASCTMVGYVYLAVVIGGLFLYARAWSEKRRRAGHAPTGAFEKQYVPNQIFWFHSIVMGLALLLTIVITAGYVAACENLRGSLNKKIYSKLNADPYDTRGEEIETRYEDDYRFHRYTNRFGNAFGSEVYTISITCRSILTDPEVHQKLHDSHYEAQSRYFGYWYGEDLFAFNSESEAAKANGLIEASMAGSWLCLFCWVAGFVLMLVQKRILHKKEQESERMSVHSTMMGTMYRDGSIAGSNFRKDASMFSGSGRASTLQRGGSIRGSDKSIRRDVDDIALSMHHLSGSRPQLPVQPPMTGYGRKDFDDMVLNQHIAMQQQSMAGSQYSAPNGMAFDHFGVSDQFHPVVPQPMGGYTVRKSPNDDSTYMHRDEVETEIF